MHFRNIVRRGLDPALERAGLERVRWHDLRHVYASLLIAQGAPVTFVSAQLGHADPAITLKVYSHLWGAAEHADRARAALEAALGKSLERSGGG